MSSTFSSRLRLELIGAGEQSGAWNNTTNTNLGTLIDEAIAGVAPITLSGATYTLDESNGASDEARQMVLVFSGTPGAAATITCPTVEKTYIVKNSTSGGFKITMKTSAGGTPVGVDIPNGSVALVYTDGTDFYNGVKDLAASATVDNVPIATTTGTQTLTNKTLTSPTINTPTISGGSITGITDLAIADGGTGASTASDARTNLGLGSLATLSVLPLGDIQDISTQRLLGRITASTGEVEQITSSQALDFVGATQGDILYRGASGWVVLPAGTSGQILASGGAAANPSWTAANTASGIPDVIIEDQKTSGTVGGSATTGAWTKRVLNTLARNNGTIASLSSDEFTLPAGTYYITAQSPFYYMTGINRIRLYNVTDASVTKLGRNAWSSGGNSPDRPNLIDASLNSSFTISGSKTFRIEYYVQSTSGGTSSLGVASSLGTEIYTTVSIWKL